MVRLYFNFNVNVSNNLTEHSPGVLHNTGLNDRIDKSVIIPTFEHSDGPNKNPDIMSTRTPSKLLSKQVWAFSELGGLNSKREAQDERSSQCACLDCCGRV